MKEILQKVRDFADRAHGDQMRKYAPDRYIVHPIRVMEICENYTQELPALVAALLHDVLEDTNTEKTEILEFLNTVMEPEEANRALRLVIELTDVYVKSDYPEWNRDKRKGKEAERLSKVSATAQTIKYADILDNSNEITKYDPHFAPKYLKEVKHVLSLAKNGNKTLYKRALNTVVGELESLGKRKS